MSVAVILLLGCLLLYQKCNKPDPMPDIAQIKMNAAQVAYDSAKRQDTPVIARLNLKSDSLSKGWAADKQRLAAANQNLQARAVDLRNTLSDLDQARASHDTAGRLLHSDTLEAEVKSGIPAIEGYTHLTDSMINSCEAQVAVKDSIIYFKDKLLHSADTAMTAQRLAFDIVHKDDASKTRQLNFYKPATAVGGGLAALLALILIFSHR